VFFHWDRRPRDNVDNIFRKLILDVFDRYQALYIELILGL